MKTKHIKYSILGLKIKITEDVYNKILAVAYNVRYNILSTFLYKYLMQPFLKVKNENKKQRYLEIGPGLTRVKDFEGANIVLNPATDYIMDVAKGIKFKDNTFDILYSSHFLEHIEWYKTKFVLSEMYRVIKPGGVVEIWVPDGLKIAKAFVEAELNISEEFKKDGWWKYNPTHDSCIWASGRIFTYGDGNKIKGHWNSHLAIFSERYLKNLLSEVGFNNIEKLDISECRGYSHGWINLGIRARK